MVVCWRCTIGGGVINSGVLQWCNGADGVMVKVKSSMARSLPVENLLAQNVGSIINYLQ